MSFFKRVEDKGKFRKRVSLWNQTDFPSRLNSYKDWLSKKFIPKPKFCIFFLSRFEYFSTQKSPSPQN